MPDGRLAVRHTAAPRPVFDKPIMALPHAAPRMVTRPRWSQARRATAPATGRRGGGPYGTSRWSHGPPGAHAGRIRHRNAA